MFELEDVFGYFKKIKIILCHYTLISETAYKNIPNMF